MPGLENTQQSMQSATGVAKANVTSFLGPWAEAPGKMTVGLKLNLDHCHAKSLLPLQWMLSIKYMQIHPGVTTRLMGRFRIFATSSGA